MSTDATSDYVCEECGYRLPTAYASRFIINNRVICPYCGRTMVKANEQ